MDSITTMDPITTPSETIKELIYQVLAGLCVIAAGLVFVAPFLVVAAGLAAVLFG